MAWCKKCGKHIDWVKGNKPNEWIPYGERGDDHRTSCVPNSIYMARRDKIMAKKQRAVGDPIQIGENEYI